MSKNKIKEVEAMDGYGKLPDPPKYRWCGMYKGSDKTIQEQKNEERDNPYNLVWDEEIFGAVKKIRSSYAKDGVGFMLAPATNKAGESLGYDVFLPGHGDCKKGLRKYPDGAIVRIVSLGKEKVPTKKGKVDAFRYDVTCKLDRDGKTPLIYKAPGMDADGFADDDLPF